MHYYFAYVLYSKRFDKFYIGYTDNLPQRLADHRSGKVHTTYRMNDLKLAYYEGCIIKRDAQDRERQLKTGYGRAYLRKRLQNYLGT